MGSNKRTQNSERAKEGCEGEFPSGDRKAGKLELIKHQLEILRTNEQLLEEIVSTENMKMAWKQVSRNKGAPGSDGKDIAESAKILKSDWEKIKQDILQGNYKPQPSREVEIPKRNGGKRKLSIPTVIDRLIQQAIAQVLSKYINASMEEESYGYRPLKSAQQATLKAQHHMQEGYNEVIDLDIENYFGTVNQDRLMSQLKSLIGDQRVLNLIRKILNNGSKTREGLPQGGPLSPLLSNIYLDPLDKELKKREHRFVRYADDVKIFVKSKRSTERVTKSIKKFLEKKLKLKTNDKKSKIGKECNILGFITNAKSIRILPEAIDHLKGKIREIVKIRGGKSITAVIKELSSLLRGWDEYYKIQTCKSKYKGINSWINRRIRALIYKSYKNGSTRYKEFKAYGMSEHVAYTCAYANYGAWSMALCKPMRIIYSGKRLHAMGLYALGSASTR